MPRGNYNEIKPTSWKGNDLKGTWEVSRKIDGARMLRDSDGNPISRNGKPLYNLEGVPNEITDAEIFDTDWSTSMGLVRSSVNGSPVPLDKVYSLDPLDPRLVLPKVLDPTAEEINKLLQQQVTKGDEGLILRQGDKWLRVKPKETADVYVIGFQTGTGKHKGKMGALLTKYGKIGTGFSDLEREKWQVRYDARPEFFTEGYQKYLIEVEYMEMTSGGKFRHPRYLHLRDDKTEESV